MFYWLYLRPLILIFHLRKKGKAAGQFKNIMNAAKLGALKGVKAKKNKNK